jgi:hypothetical protein
LDGATVPEISREAHRRAHVLHQKSFEEFSLRLRPLRNAGIEREQHLDHLARARLVVGLDQCLGQMKAHYATDAIANLLPNPSRPSIGTPGPSGPAGPPENRLEFGTECLMVMLSSPTTTSLTSNLTERRGQSFPKLARSLVNRTALSSAVPRFGLI